MPKKAQETEEKKSTTKAEKKSTKKTTNKTTANSSKVKTEKVTAKKATAKKSTANTKKTATKSTSSTKKATSSKSTAKKTTTKKSTVAKKASTTKKAVTKRTTKKVVKKEPVVEYYDLPYRYNQTVVKLLAQTPDTLFIYWDISDDDRENYKKTYGENFFETTKPVLIVHNDTMNYSFEVDINDFANSWYLHVNDSKCDYRIELGRRVINNNIGNHEDKKEIKKLNMNDYIYISSSNEIESPNNRVLFNKTQKMVYFRNVKNNQETTKNISSFTFMRNMGKIYDIYDLYKEIYKDENIDEFSNPSSNYFKGDR